jgi:hypothetical protein
MRFRLRTLLILLAVAPPVLAILLVSFLGLRQKPLSAAGIVTYRGQPVANGTVEFVSISKAQHRFVAKTDDQGRYNLDGARTSPPLKPGTYRISIAAPGQGRLAGSELVTDLQPESKNEIHFDLR